MPGAAVGKSVGSVDKRLREAPHKDRRPRRCVYCGWLTYPGPACGHCADVFQLDPAYHEARRMTL